MHCATKKKWLSKFFVLFYLPGHLTFLARNSTNLEGACVNTVLAYISKKFVIGEASIQDS